MYKRKIIKNIEKYLDKKEIIILLWARQVGKTSIMKYFFEKLKKQKLWLNLDKFSDCEKFSSSENIINYLKINDFDLEKKIFLFVDEFQYCKNSSLIFKNIYDEYENIKIIASGSSSMDIKDKIQESLAGRKKIFYIYPLDLEEFISWKFILSWKKDDLINFKKFSEIDWKLEKIATDYYKYLYEFMIFGWYPKTVLEKEKIDILENIFDLYLKKDILDFLNIKNIDWFKKIVSYLAINNWWQINYTDLSNFSWVDVNTLKSYLEILEETFIVKQVKPFFTNKNKEIVKVPKIYFLDNWVRNYFIKNFLLELDLRVDKWELFEAVVLQELIKNNIWEIKYWRTKSWVEVDFIVDNVINFDILEVKFKNKLKNSDFRGLEILKKEYKEKVRNSYLVWKDRDLWSISIFDLIKN